MWPFQGTSKPRSSAMTFKSGDAFIDYHCKFMVTRLEPGSPLAALVLDASELFDTPLAVTKDERGVQKVALRVASDDGGFTVLAETASGAGEALKPGDVVA